MIAEALIRLRPGAQWTISGDDYSGIAWIDTEQTMPTEEEVLSLVSVIKQEVADKQYQRKRAAEYPPITDYLDAVVKNDTEQMQAYIDACLAVKAKYPKPE